MRLDHPDDSRGARWQVKVCAVLMLLGTVPGGVSLGVVTLQVVLGWNLRSHGTPLQFIAFLGVMALSITCSAALTAVVLRVAARKILSTDEFVLLFAAGPRSPVVERFVRWFLRIT